MSKTNFTEEFKRDAVRQITERGYLLEGIDWRNPRWTQRPATAG